MRPRSLRSRAALTATRLTAEASRRAGFGSGSTVGGRIGLAIDPELLTVLGEGRKIALVSGTNGKTTTTCLLAEAMRTTGAVATSSAGANLPAGLAAALAAEPTAPVAVLEVDEAWLPLAIAALRPAVVVLLNLSRDQLDRVSEVRMLARRWRDALAGFEGVVVANIDDPLVTWASNLAAHRRAVAAGGRWRADAWHCPECGARLSVGAEGWSCTCHLARPAPDARLEDDTLRVADAAPVRLQLCLPGRFNLANAALAATAAVELGVPLARALAAMSKVEEVAGRYAAVQVGTASARLLLAKNPAGWTELLELVRDDDAPAVIGINARVADGRDPSWLWDVPFELLAGRQVVATGDRRRDLAVRLVHAGVEHAVSDDARAAIAAFVGPVDYVGNYTAFQDLRRSLARTASATPRVTPTAAAPEPRRTRRLPGGGRRGPSDGVLSIVVVHPDLLGTYGDGGNAMVLANRARWRGEHADVVFAPSDAPLPRSADLYLLGGGEDGPQAHSAAALADGALSDAVRRGAVVLAICAGYQILGRTFPGPAGERLAGVGLLEVDTVAAGPRRRAVGEILVARPGAPDGDDLLLSGFENHAGRTRRDPGVAALGRVLSGVGNGDGTDGARAGRVLATYLHGPVLARNPRLADELLSLALGRALSPLADEEEEALRRERLAAVRRARR